MFKSFKKTDKDSYKDLKYLNFKDSPSNQIINILKKSSSSKLIIYKPKDPIK